MLEKCLARGIPSIASSGRCKEKRGKILNGEKGIVDKTEELPKREEEAFIYLDVGKPPRAPDTRARRITCGSGRECGGHRMSAYWRMLIGLLCLSFSGRRRALKIS